jgi:predicted AAA+ superfamily ATPase
MGKSSLVKALHATVNATHARCKGGDGQLKLIEIHRQDIESLPDLMVLMRGAPYRFIVHLGHSPRWTAQGLCEMQSTQPQ